MMDQEIGRIPEVRKLYKTGLRVPFMKIFSKILRLNVQLLSTLDGPRMMRKSSELQNFGWFVIAEKK